MHARIVELARRRAAHEHELGRWLVAAARLGVHTRAGYASLREYAERVVGLSGRQTEERLRAARALRDLPRLDSALAAGDISFSAVRELSRIATADTEQAWIGWATDKRVRQIEKAVAARQPGDRPSDKGDPKRVRHRLAFEVRAETLAMFRDLQAAVKRDLGSDVDDDTVLFELARRALRSPSGGPDDEGRASYQLAVSRCDACGTTSIDAGGQSHVVDEAVAEMVACDAQRIGRVDGPSPHTGAEGDNPPRATPSIPPARRRAVMRRDKRRCLVPGCENHRYLDVHHLDPRAEGGSHDPDRLAVLCGAHHRAVHAGRLCIDGTASSGFSMRHPDGKRYGAPLHPAAIEVAAQALSALTHMGFKSKQARALVEAVQEAGAPDELSEFVRAALKRT